MRRTPELLKRLAWAVLTAWLAALLVLPSVDARLWLAFFAVLALALAGTLLDTRWSREHIRWLQSPRMKILDLYRDLYAAKADVEPYKDGAPNFPHAVWLDRIAALEGRFEMTMNAEAAFIWQHEQRHRRLSLESLQGLDEATASQKIHALLNERLELLATVMREPGLD